MLLRALEAPDSIAALGDQKVGDRSLPAVSIKTRAGTFTVLFDRTTHLPAIIRTRDADSVYGDSNYDLVLSDWKDVGGGAKRAAYAVVPTQRRGSAAADLERGYPRYADTGRHLCRQR
jgi:hypothetical protein